MFAKYPRFCAATNITERLAATGRFTPRQLDGVGVQILVDGEPFVPRTSDPLLTSLELGWLPEVVLLGHEILGERLERGVQPITIERRIQAIRVRCCQAIALVVDQDDVSPTDNMAWYGFEHPELPTLILSDHVRLTRMTLGRDLSRTVSQLIDKRLWFLESLLLRLALDQDSDTVEAPGDEALAVALGCDARTLQEHRTASRKDLGHVLHLLVPVVAYFAGVTVARQLESDAERAGGAFDLAQWRRSRFRFPEPAPHELIEACGRASDRPALRKELGLDYERFNGVLLALGELPISNEAELRSMYRAYLQRMGPRILERLRRHHATDFRDGRDLSVYVDRKTLAFLGFDPAWTLTRETLDNETVEAHVARLLDDVLGEDHEADLAPSRGLVETNRKTVRRFAAHAISVVGAWCRRNRVPVPEPWPSEDPQTVARYLENAGLLDFELVHDDKIPGLCARTACWPPTMPRTIHPALLGLDRAAVEAEEKRRERERQRRIIEQRSVDFAGTRLDTGDPSFPETFRQLAENSIAGDHGWLERSRRPRLAEFANPEGGGRQPGGWTGGGAGRRESPPEDQRRAMGLASEWLVFQYLRSRHGEVVDENCWVSTNWARFFGGDEGDDAAGYDFCVRMPRREWLYEVKSSLEDTREFELTTNEMRVAASASKEGRRRYRILYVPFVFRPDRWFVLELPNPMGDGTRNRFRQIGRGSVRFRLGLHVEGNISASQAERIARLTLGAVRGSDDGFQIEIGGEGAPVNTVEPTKRGRTRGGSSPKPESFTSRKPIAFVLGGRRHEVTRWREVFRGVCEILATDAGADFHQRVVQVRGRRRVYFSKDPAVLHHPLRLAETGLFAEGNLSANDCVRLARRVLVAVRGSDEGFEVVAKNPRGSSQLEGHAARVR